MDMENILRSIMEKRPDADGKSPVVIAIDGRAASGKTTLAAGLEKELGASVIHMDDFFLPNMLRTAERFAEPGGNVHYERFLREVLPFLRETRPFDYRIFDCGTMAYNGTRTVGASRWRVVEGSYSCHPVFGEYADLRIFCDIAPEEQKTRILRRDGAEKEKLFAQKWIPLEEAYFNRFDIARKADIQVR